ncbi:transcription elongation factor GreA [Hyphomicrobium sulfonivorans]|uniref:Transcription elongation factor GreB n=1 Tax=Hyphomicrobium sulfonivorans TaxID=121290 RepID=A0A109BDL7_HYPSL|nr:transcription elongation factor GreA [Hyphomicrobium sulfonivorans]KWT66831.1 Transcription elongation factor GreB [Hyphomicrobium sulfonivorans]MBI1650628.1 transcription elongation factor GreA [Hyphomicrobium sulfonivorans]NSL72013.1 transcription elongation factor GreA [Hyphomicrobium sulfonivorans]
MSRAFVKEQDSVDELPDRLISEHANLVTAEGLAQIEVEVSRLDAAHATAQADGDRAEMAATARNLRYWSARLASAELVPPAADTTIVQFGLTITIEREDGRKQTYRIVGEDEADPAKGSISYVSPLARALAGKSIGDSVRVAGGEAEIVAIT